MNVRLGHHKFRSYPQWGARIHASFALRRFPRTHPNFEKRKPPQTYSPQVPLTPIFPYVHLYTRYIYIYIYIDLSLSRSLSISRSLSLALSLSLVRSLSLSLSRVAFSLYRYRYIDMHIYMCILYIPWKAHLLPWPCCWHIAAAWQILRIDPTGTVSSTLRRAGAGFLQLSLYDPHICLFQRQ